MKETLINQIKQTRYSNPTEIRRKIRRKQYLYTRSEIEQLQEQVLEIKERQIRTGLTPEIIDFVLYFCDVKNDWNKLHEC